MRRGRQIGAGVALAAVSAGVTLVLLVPATGVASITGPCHGTINGASVAGRSLSAGDAIDVNQHSAVPVGMSAAGEISHYKVAISFGGFSWTVKDADTKSNSWSDSVAVDRYATYGVGLYQVSGSSTGPGLSCSGAALVKVSGNPLSTVAGEVGLGLAGLGIAGVAAAGIGAAGQGRSGARSIEQWTTDQLDNLNKAEDQKAQSERQQREAENIGVALSVSGMDRFCFFWALSAIMLTTGAMIGGGGGAVSAGGGAGRLPRAHWRPRISVVGFLSGLLGGIGGGVLLQEYAVLFPTRGVAITELVVGVASGLVLPSVGRWFAVRRINRAVAAAEQRLAAARAGA